MFFCLSGRSACAKSSFLTPTIEITIIIKYNSIYSIIRRRRRYNIRVIRVHPIVQVFIIIVEKCSGGAGTTRLLSVGGRKGDCGGGCFLFCFRL